MKKIWIMSLLIMAGLSLSAQQASWKEMHDFHDIMSVTFHPAEENNLQPLKDSAAVLVERAKTWKKSTVPEGYNGAVTQPILEKLVTECKAIKAAVAAKKTDAELKAMITKAHDIFHEIMEKCRK
ncbi:MAG TPA: hypothetical protein PLZ10_08635, partial [Chitinophagaceae bacterium]|nr:hypothetical protein [Chitinophagaceae bacterium]